MITEKRKRLLEGLIVAEELILTILAASFVQGIRVAGSVKILASIVSLDALIAASAKEGGHNNGSDNNANNRTNTKGSGDDNLILAEFWSEVGAGAVVASAEVALALGRADHEGRGALADGIAEVRGARELVVAGLVGVDAALGRNTRVSCANVEVVAEGGRARSDDAANLVVAGGRDALIEGGAGLPDILAHSSG
jgi:hypothetical protein